MDRDLELRLKGHLYEINTANDEVIESRQGMHSSAEGYRKSLESVAECAGPEMVDEIAGYIKEHIEKGKGRPENRKVRKRARIRLSRAGFVLDDYLNQA